MKRISVLLLVAFLAFGCASNNQPKYVFYFIGDGMGINQVRGTEIYNQATGNGPEVINFTQFPVQSYVTTHSASALVTDSAAAGTALATGVKTYNSGMGNLPKAVSQRAFGRHFHRLLTPMEALLCSA